MKYILIAIIAFAAVGAAGFAGPVFAGDNAAAWEIHMMLCPPDNTPAGMKTFNFKNGDKINYVLTYQNGREIPPNVGSQITIIGRLENNVWASDYFAPEPGEFSDNVFKINIKYVKYIGPTTARIPPNSVYFYAFLPSFNAGNYKVELDFTDYEYTGNKSEITPSKNKTSKFSTMKKEFTVKRYFPFDASKLTDAQLKTILAEADKIKASDEQDNIKMPKLYALLRPGIPKDVVMKILVARNPNANLSRNFNYLPIGAEVVSYHAGGYNIWLAFWNDIMIDNIEDLMRMAGTQYEDEKTKDIAIKRLKEIPTSYFFPELMDGQGTDLQNWAARALYRAKDINAFHLLLTALERNNFIAVGSENHTIHLGLKEVLLKNLDKMVEENADASAVKIGKHESADANLDSQKFIANAIADYRKWWSGVDVKKLKTDPAPEK
jgi:hypothetical protein